MCSNGALRGREQLISLSSSNDRLIACEKLGVSGSFACGVEALNKKNPFGLRVCCAVEVEVDDVPVYSIFSFFFSSFLFFFFLFFFLSFFLDYYKLL